MSHFPTGWVGVEVIPSCTVMEFILAISMLTWRLILVFWTQIFRNREVRHIILVPTVSLNKRRPWSTKSARKLWGNRGCFRAVWSSLQFQLSGLELGFCPYRSICVVSLAVSHTIPNEKSSLYFTIVQLRKPRNYKDYVFLSRFPNI